LDHFGPPKDGIKKKNEAMLLSSFFNPNEEATYSQLFLKNGAIKKWERERKHGIILEEKKNEMDRSLTGGPRQFLIN
jgi:hypothetical protein